MNYILELSNKDLKAAIIKILHHSIKILLKKTKKKKGNLSQEKELIKTIRNYRTENYKGKKNLLDGLKSSNYKGQNS